jgi:hypothetical protein
LAEQADPIATVTTPKAIRTARARQAECAVRARAWESGIMKALRESSARMPVVKRGG